MSEDNDASDSVSLDSNRVVVLHTHHCLSSNHAGPLSACQNRVRYSHKNRHSEG